MNNESFRWKVYSIFFVASFFVMMLAQLLSPGMTLSLISEKYLWRKTLVKTYNNFKFQIGDRVFQDSVVGKDGWLYYTAVLSMKDYQKIPSINKGNLKRLTRILKEIKDETEQYGGTFLLIIPPDKSTVYPQYMPDEIPVIGQASNLDHLIEYLDKNSDIQVLDLRPLFSELSKDADLYYKTDTHWDCLGAFYASNKTLSIISNSYPQIQPSSLNDFKFASRTSVMDISSMIGLSIQEDYMIPIPKPGIHISNSLIKNIDHEIPSLKVTVNDKKNLPNLVVFHDSFYECMKVFFEPNFSRTVSMHFMDAELADYLDIISAEKPDVVIVEFVERSMDYFYEHLSK